MVLTTLQLCTGTMKSRMSERPCGIIEYPCRKADYPCRMTEYFLSRAEREEVVSEAMGVERLERTDSAHLVRGRPAWLPGPPIGCYPIVVRYSRNTQYRAVADQST